MACSFIGANAFLDWNKPLECLADAEKCIQIQPTFVKVSLSLHRHSLFLIVQAYIRKCYALRDLERFDEAADLVLKMKAMENVEEFQS